MPGSGARTIRELYPDSREVVLVRDFRDMVCSIFDYNAKRGFEMWGRDEFDNEEQWFEHQRTQVRRLLDDWRERRDNTHLLRYEDLVADPAAALMATLEYCGLDAREATIKRIVDGAARTRPKAQDYHRTSRSFKGSVGRWKRDLSPHHKALCAEAFGDLLVECGYEEI
jgi:hypothetical protein